MTDRSFEARTPLLIVAVAVAVAVVAILAGRASGATAETPYDVSRIDAPASQTDRRWGERLAVAGDLDDDGVNDFFVADPYLDLNGSDRGRVYLLSGRTRRVIRPFDSPEPQDKASFGFFISVFGDADGDGESDIAIGTDVQDVAGNKDQGKAWVFSGDDGRVLHELDNPEPQSSGRFGSRIGAAGDVNRNGAPDVIVGASNNDIPAGCGEDGTVEQGCFQNVGQAFIFDGRTGDRVRTLDIPAGERPGGTRCTSSCGSLGLAVQGPGDTNGDGVTDHLVGASSYDNGAGRMYVFDGRTGAVRLRIDSPQPERGEFFGFQDAAPLSPGDVNGDGRADLYGHGFLADGPTGSGQGRAWIFNGRNGALIRALDDPTPTEGGQFGFSLSVTDFNGDGTPDQYVGQAPHHIPVGDQNGGTYVFDGRDGSVLKRFEVPASDRQPSVRGNGGPRLGWTSAAAGDLNRDGEPDFLGGAPFADVNGVVDQGRVYAFISRLGLHPPIDRFGGTSVWSVREGERFFLVAEREGTTRRLAIRSRGVPFDVDLGPDEDGDVVAAYSRCEQEPRVPRITSRLYSTPVAAYSTGRGCDIYRYDFKSGRERKLPGASTGQASEFLPSIWRDDVAFGRVYERRGGRRGVYPYLYVRALEGGRSDRQPGGSRGVTGLPGPTSVDLYGRRLSFVWNYARRDTDKGTRNDDEGTTQVRLDTVGRRGSRVISEADFGEGTYASFLTPKGSGGRITYGFQRVADLEKEEGPRSISSIMLRYRLSNGDKSVANPPGTLLASGALDDGQLLIHVPERFGPAPFGQILEADRTRFVD